MSSAGCSIADEPVAVFQDLVDLVDWPAGEPGGRPRRKGPSAPVVALRWALPTSVHSARAWRGMSSKASLAARIRRHRRTTLTVPSSITSPLSEQVRGLELEGGGTRESADRSSIEDMHAGLEFRGACAGGRCHSPVRLGRSNRLNDMRRLRFALPSGFLALGFCLGFRRTFCAPPAPDAWASAPPRCRVLP